MTTNTAQDFLFQRIKEMLPPDVSMADAISEVLNVSSDSSYRRIRGETPLVLQEAKQLCDHFHISLDQLLEVRSGSTIFQNIRIDTRQYNYEQYLRGLLQELQQLRNFLHTDIIYLSKDIPIFHNFYHKPLAAFRYFFWMKTMLADPGFVTRHFDFNCITPGIEKLSQDLLREYQAVPSTEIWNTESINSLISQIEFYKDAGYFSSAADIKTIYGSLEETILHMKEQVEYGCKFMPGETPQVKKNNFKFFFNRVILGDNTILVITDRGRTAYINYGLLNYIVTSDATFCKNCYDDIENLKKRSTMLSQSSEKQRNNFFNSILNRIHELKIHT